MINSKSTITYPDCGGQTTELLPITYCFLVYKCPHCEEVLRPLDGDCCVFCSYGDNPCPLKQNEEEIT